MGLRMRLGLESDMMIVGEAANGADALAGVQTLHPDVVVIDYQMPGLDGLATLREARACGCASSFVMLSGHFSAAIAPMAIEAGAAAYVGKHESDIALLSAIRQAARRGPEGSIRHELMTRP